MKSPAIFALAFLPCALLTPRAHAEESGFIPAQGTVWTSIAWEYWGADERFAGPFGFDDVNFRGFPDPANPTAFDDQAAEQIEPGDIVPVSLEVPGASFSLHGLNYKLRVVPLPRLLLRAAARLYQRSAYQQAGSTLATTGSGDIVATLGYQVTEAGSPVGTSLYLHTKIPTTGPQLDGVSVPLSEGQVDIGIEQATTWAVLPQLWLTGRLQYRYRFEGEQRRGGSTALVKPGDEVEASVEAAGEPLPLLWLKTSYTGTWATTSEDRSIPNRIDPLEKRQIHWWGMDAYYRFGAWFSAHLDQLAIDLKFRYPLGGTDYLRGPRFDVGLAYQLNWNQL